MKRFAKADPMPQGGKAYRKKHAVTMWRMDEPFECESREGVLTGQPGDFLVQDGHGGYYPCSARFHDANYEIVGED